MFGKILEKFKNLFRNRNYKNLHCPRCGAKLSHLQPWYQETLDDYPDLFGLDVYCEVCEFSGDIRPDDLTEDKLQKIKPKEGWN